jgi:hypothetical protein
MSITVTSLSFDATFPSFNIVDIDKLLGKNEACLCMFGSNKETAHKGRECNTLGILLLRAQLRLA